MEKAERSVSQHILSSLERCIWKLSLEIIDASLTSHNQWETLWFPSKINESQLMGTWSRSSEYRGERQTKADMPGSRCRNLY